MWPVTTHPLGFRNRATGEFSAFVPRALHWGLIEDGGFFVSCPGCFNAPVPTHCGDDCASRSYGAVLDYVVPQNQQPAPTKTINGGIAPDGLSAAASRAQAASAAALAPEKRVVVTEGIVPYRWTSKEARPTSKGEPLFTNTRGFQLTTERGPEFSVFVGLYFGDAPEANEIFVLIGA